jgi:hypothetical protein
MAETLVMRTAQWHGRLLLHLVLCSSQLSLPQASMCMCVASVCYHRRKNVGYMYAIHNGATAVYDGDAGSLLLEGHVPMLACSADAHELTSNITSAPCLGPYTVLDASKMAQDNQASGAASRPAVLNPYPLFGQSNLWPRDMPTQTSLHDGPFCFSRRPARPLIQQALTNGEPNAGLRPYLGQGARARGMPQQPGVTFDPSAFSVVLPEGVLTPVNRCGGPAGCTQEPPHDHLLPPFSAAAHSVATIVASVNLSHGLRPRMQNVNSSSSERTAHCFDVCRHNTIFLQDALWTLLLPVGDNR